MNHKPIQLLAKKFAHKLNQLNNPYDKQKDELLKFTEDFSDLLQKTQNELLNDFLELKESWINFPKELQSTMKDILNNVMEINKNLISEDPYISANMLINYLSDKKNKILIDNIEFIITETLKKHKLDIKKFNGIKSLKSLGVFVTHFIKQNSSTPNKDKNLMPAEIITNFPKEKLQIKSPQPDSLTRIGEIDLNKTS